MELIRTTLLIDATKFKRLKMIAIQYDTDIYKLLNEGSELMLKCTNSLVFRKIENKSLKKITSYIYDDYYKSISSIAVKYNLYIYDVIALIVDLILKKYPID